MQRWIFVVGPQRSGTTLTGQILGGAPEVLLIDEPDGFMRWIRHELDGRSWWRCRLSEAQVLIRARRKYRVRRRSLGKRRVLAFKAPNLTYEASAISRLRAECSIVYLRRDVRDVVASMRKTAPVLLANQEKLLRAQPELAARFGCESELVFDRAAPEHLRLAAVAKIKMSLRDQFVAAGLATIPLQYEELVRSPRSVIGDLLLRLDLEGASAAESYFKVMQGVGPGGTQREKPISSDSVGRWRQALSSSEATEIEELVGADLLWD